MKNLEIKKYILNFVFLTERKRLTLNKKKYTKKDSIIIFELKKNCDLIYYSD